MRLMLPHLCLVLLVAICTYGQDTTLVYFDKDWKEVDSQHRASFYRKAFQDSNKVWTAYDYFIDGNIQMTGTFTSKKFTVKNGHFVYYYESGGISEQGEVVNNKNEGIWTYWYENGKKRSQGEFRRGMKQDRWVYWYDNGTQKSEGVYIDNMAENYWEYWFETGEKLSQGKFLHDMKDGIWRHLYTSGKLKSEEGYKSGQLGYVTSYYECGKPKFSWTIHGGNGEGIFYSIDGHTVLKGLLTNGLREGEWTRYFANNESMKMHYEKGVLVSKPLGGIYRMEF